MSFLDSVGGVLSSVGRGLERAAGVAVDFLETPLGQEVGSRLLNNILPPPVPTGTFGGGGRPRVNSGVVTVRPPMIPGLIAPTVFRAPSPAPMEVRAPMINVATPGGAVIGQNRIGSAINSFLGIGGGGGSCGSLFRAGGTTIRPSPLIMVPHPETGAPVFFKHAGRPVLFSGDLTAAKRVSKLARRARRGR